MSDRSDLDILADLGVEPVRSHTATHTPREARIIAGFEDIQKFVEDAGHPPRHGPNLDIFERLYAVRRDRLRAQEDCRALLAPLDHQGLLTEARAGSEVDPESLDDDSLLAELGVSTDADNSIEDLKHVRSRDEIRAAEIIAARTKCEDFATFEPLFAQVRAEIRTGRRKTRRYARMAGIKQGEFFIVNGQIAYVAEVSKEFETQYDRRDSRLRVIYDNGTESDLLLRSLQRALHRDETGRRVTDPDAGPLFEAEEDSAGSETGTIYVLRSLSGHPHIQANRAVIHKIGVTGGDVEKRLVNAERDPTFLMAPVEIVATYRLEDINRTALENLLHRFFAPARLDISIPDRFGQAVKPHEWFVVSLPVINDAVDRVRDGTLHLYEYDLRSASLRPRGPRNLL